MNDRPILVLAAMFGGFALLELALGCFQPAARRRDAWIELLGSTCLLAITLPAVTSRSRRVVGTLLPKA